MAVNFRRHTPQDSPAIAALFTEVFTQSEGAAEGRLIGQLAEDLLARTEPPDLDCFVAIDADQQILGGVFFSRVSITNDAVVFLLAPVAVHRDHQGQGIGQALINYGLGELRRRGVSAVLTYGDPAFYSKVGFRRISPEIIQAPFALSQPEGWLGQSLTNDAIAQLVGRCECVAALSDPVYW